MELLGNFDSLGPKIGVGMHVREDNVILLFPSIFFLKLNEMSVGQFLHTKGSHRMLKIQAAITYTKSKDILDCSDLVRRPK